MVMVAAVTESSISVNKKVMVVKKHLTNNEEAWKKALKFLFYIIIRAAHF